LATASGFKKLNKSGHNFKSTLRQVLLCCMLFIVAACEGGGLGGKEPISSGVFSETPGSQGAIGGKAAVGAQKVFAANESNSNTDSSDYKISPLDVLEITVLGLPDLTRTTQVSSSGQISLPLINQVKAGGRTSSQLETAIAQKLSATYLQSPQVTVFVKEYNSQKITVDGAVNKPGIFPVTGQTSLMQAIALAEGLTLVADTSGVLIFRTVNNKRLAARYDIKQVRTGKVQDPKLQAGDIVMVDESSARTTFRDVKDALPLTGLFQLLLL
jgi:polysaccharide biosynthesis/export protein